MRSASSLPCKRRRFVVHHKIKRKQQRMGERSYDVNIYVCMYMKECESEETDCILCWGVGGGENGNTE